MLRLPVALSIRSLGALLLLMPAAPCEASADAPLALVGGRVIVRAGEAPLENATVLLRDGRVQAVGPDLELPFDARAVDVTGLTLTAAFLDALVQRDFPFAERSDQQGRPYDTLDDIVVSMPEGDRRGLRPERDAASALPPDGADDESRRSAGFAAAFIAPTGQLLPGAGALVVLSGRPPREAVLQAGAAQLCELAWRSGPENYRGYDYPATLMGVMAHLRQAFLDAQHEGLLADRHVHADPPRRGAADPTLAALLPVLQGAQPLVVVAHEAEDIRLALGLAQDFPGLRVVIAGGTEAWKLADELAERRVAVIHDLRFGAEPEDPDEPGAGKDERDADDEAPDDAATDEEAPDDATDDAVVEEALDDRSSDVSTSDTTSESAEDSARAGDELSAAVSAEAVDASDEDADAADESAPAQREPWQPALPKRLLRDRHDRWLANVRGVATLQAAGVELAFGSLARSADDLLESVRVIIEQGEFPADAALAALTRGPRAIFGVRTPSGELVAGAAAQVAAFDGDPLDADSRARVLVVDGVLFDLRDQPDGRKSAGKRAKKSKAGAKEVASEAPSDPATDPVAVADAQEPAADAEAPVAWPVELDSDREPDFRTGGDVLVRGATILTVSNGTLADHDLLVRDGVITAIGQALAVPDGVRVVDARGQFLLPGIIDCHSHVAIRGGVNEWTRSLTPEVTIEDQVDPDDIGIYRALAGGATSARLLHGSANAIGGRHEIIKFRWGRSAPELVFEGAPRGVKFALGENPKQSNFGGGSRFPRTRMGVEAVLRRALRAGREYAGTWAAFHAATQAGESPDPPRRDLRLEALAGMLDGSIGVHSHCYQADEMLMLLRVAEDFGFRVKTLQHVLEGYKVAAEIAAHGAGGSTFVDWWAFKFEVWDATPYCAALMNEAGVLMSVNSDSDEHLRRLHLEAAKTSKYGGVPEEQALAMVTLNPAKQLGIDARVGSIEVGKDADFALYSRHPFDVRTHVLMTFVDGELYFQRRADRYDDYATAIRSRIEAGRAATDPAPEPSLVEARARDVSPEALSTLNLPRGANRAPTTPARPAGPAIALVGGTVHTMERDGGTQAVHAPGVVLMEGGVIRGVYAGSDAPPAGYAVVDVSGRHVWPGFIDAGTQIGLLEIESVQGTADHREVGSDQPDLRASAAYHADSEHVAVARVNGTTTALVAPAARRIAGLSSAMALEGWTANEALVKDAVALHVAAPRTPREIIKPEDRAPASGARDHAHVCEGGPIVGATATATEDEDDEEEDDSKRPLPERLAENWHELHTLFSGAREYARVAGEAARRGVPGPAHDPRLEALAPFALGQAPVVFEADWADQIMDALDFAEELGLRPIIAGGQQAWMVADRLALTDVPVLVGPVLSLPFERHEPYDAPYQNAAALHAAGVRFCFRSNSSSSARDLPYHAGMAVAFGLPEDEALHALTAGAAQILGLADSVGTLAPGKRADVIVTDGDPLQVRTALTHLFIGGRDVGLVTRHTRLYDRFRGRLIDPAQPNR